MFSVSLKSRLLLINPTCAYLPLGQDYLLRRIVMAVYLSSKIKSILIICKFQISIGDPSVTQIMATRSHLLAIVASPEFGTTDQE